MGLPPGTRLDSYAITGPLGSGGMGEVYRARDTRLGREVAVKALPEAFALDLVRLARFEREAQALAALNHPNIAVIHELKEVDGSKYLIMELVEGETLAELIAGGPLCLEEALIIARQIAEAVESAHDRGIVHRDLKPANVKITPEGRIKVLDFGLAKFQESPSGARSVSQKASASGALSTLATAGGALLGTAPYMSPEQARGKNVDRRADVWAFGCVLFELLAGRRPFPPGETVSDTLAHIIAREPDWQALPPEVPPRIRALLERCLRKDPQRRLQDMGNARIELEEASGESGSGTAAVADAAAVVPKPARGREIWLGAAVAVSLLLAVGLAIAVFFAPAPARPVQRFEAGLPGNLAPDSGFTLSPDGLSLAFVTSQPSQLWVRALGAAAAQPIPSTEGIAGANVFWSPDSKDIGFFADAKLKRVAAAGGPAQGLCSLPAGGNYYGTWSAQGVILVASDSSPGGPLLRIPAGGGAPAPVTELDKSLNETSHRYPHFLPDGRHFVYLATGSDARDRATYAGDLDSKERRRLTGIAAQAQYSSSGHLLFIRDGALMAQPFDAGRLELSGAPFPVADPFAPAAALAYPFSLSMTGALTYRSDGVNRNAGGIGSGPTQLWWYDKRGMRQSPVGDAEFRGPELSPDARYVAFARGAPADIWVLDIQNARTDRLTSDAAEDLNPRWSPDGKTIAFDSTRGGVANIYSRAFGVVGEDQLVLKTGSTKTLSDWTRNGKYFVYTADNDIWALPFSGTSRDAKPIQITKTPFIERTPRVSPDGRWVAYVSNEPGEDRVYIQSFPEPRIKQPVSTAGGVDPRWSADSKELFYYSGLFPYIGSTGTVFAASIQGTGSSLTVGAPAPRAARAFPGTTSYSVAADGRFLMQTVVLGSGAIPGTAGQDMGGRPIGTNREWGVITIILEWAAKK